MTDHRRSRILLAAAVSGVALMAAAGPVLAQTTSDGVTVFWAEAYADQAPANALDMLARTPGFSLVEPDADVRGYGGAQGNLLVDGARPASKREDISDLLRRIPAASVERIELIYAGRAGVDMAGYPVLANIVRRRDVAAEGAVELQALASTDGWSALGGAAEYSRRWGERSLELSAKVEPELDDDSGEGRITTSGPDGEDAETSALDTRTTKLTAEAGAVWRQPLAGGELTASGAARGEQARTTTDIVAQTPGAETQAVTEREDFSEAEAALRWERTFGVNRLELLASHRLGRLEGRETALEDGETEAFQEDTDTGETIVRAELTRKQTDQLSLSASVEGAFNFLESASRLTEDGVAVDLPGSDVRIEETRFEGAVGATWTPSEAWTFEAGLRVETSTITQTGDTPLSRDFVYPKPRLAARWDASARDQLRLSLSREVGQLDFGDFVASASLDSGTVSAGNAELEPDKTWRMVAAWERRLPGDGSLTLTWTHDRIEDVVDRVLVEAGGEVFDAPGNIGDGRRDTLALEFQTPLDRLGLTGGQLRTALLWRDSSVVDPATGADRPISEEKPFEGEIEITQDLPAHRLRWGVTIDHIAERKTQYRFDEIKREREDLGWTVFIERRIGDRWRLRAEATDLFGRGFEERREKYDGPRSSYPVEEIERRERETPGFVSLSIRRSMGG